MSQYIFPSQLQGFKIDVQRSLINKTTRWEAPNGKFQKISWWDSPRYRYSVSFDILRSTAVAEYQQLCTTFERVLGQFDDLLFSDPADNVVTDHGCGVSDGILSHFQLQRTPSGVITDQYGTWDNGTKPRVNFFPKSQALDDASWLKGNATAVAAQAIAPDGTLTGCKVVENTASGLHFVDYDFPSAGTLLDNTVYVVSVFARAGERPVVAIGTRTKSGTFPNAYFDLVNGVATFFGTQPLAFDMKAVGGGWWRCWVAINVLAGTTVPQANFDMGTSFTGGGTTYTGDGSSGLYLWGAQYEKAVNQASPAPSQYILNTTTGTATDTPLYYPAFGDGFEPIKDLRQALPYEVSGDATYDGTPTVWLDGDWQGKRRLYQTSRTNIYPHSEDVDNAYWGLTNVSITANATTAPDGTSTADFVKENTSNSTHFYGPNVQPTLTQNVRYMKSVFAKTNGRDLLLEGRAHTGLFYNMIFNLTTGAITAVSGGNVPPAFGVFHYPNGWWRCWIGWDTGTGSVGHSDGQYLYNSTSGAFSYTGDGSSGAYCWGNQLEIVGPTVTAPTPYIKTAGSTVTVADYTIDTQGVLNVIPVPAAGAFLSWTGAYYRRVQFDLDQMDTTRVVQQWWETQQIDLVSIK